MKSNSKSEYPRILVISNNSFSDTSNNGKTLASFFKGFPSENIAQLYFNTELPSDTYYNNYFRITDTEIVKSFMVKEEPGKPILCSDVKSKNIESKDKRSALSKIKKYNLSRIARELFWMNKRWKTDKLDLWLDNFDAEIIFLCAGDTGFAYDIAEYIQNKLQTKLIVYITDDYILPRKTISPFWWIRRNYIYNKMEKSIHISDLFITISEEMRKTYKKVFGIDSILAINMTRSMKENDIKYLIKDQENITFVYAGGLHFKRYKTLNLLAKSIKKYNLKSEGKKAFLEIYSGSQPEKDVENQLNIEGASKYCGSLNKEEVKVVLNKCNIPVHVESFDRKSIESTRLSISTKIPEYLSLGKPVLAIGPYEVASIKYLEDSAFCIMNPDEIYMELSKLLEDDELKDSLSNKALIKFEENHNPDMILRNLNESILEIYSSNI